MSGQENFYSEFTTDSYKRLVDSWSAEKMQDYDFKYENEVIGENTLSTLFFEQILKKVLTRISFFLKDDIESSEVKGEIDKVIDVLKPIIDSATKPEYDKSPITEAEFSVIKKLPVTFFSPWLVLTLERDLFPYRKSLEITLKSEGF